MEYFSQYIELSIIKSWLQGYTRDEIAQEFGKSNGTISNTIAIFRNKLGHYDADAIRELAKQLRRLEITPDSCAIGFRIFKILEKINIQETKKIEEFLTSIFEFSQQMDINSEIFRDILLEFVKISQVTPFSEIPSYLQKTREDVNNLENKKKRLEEEIVNLEREKEEKEEKTRSSLNYANTTLFNLDIFVLTKNKLESYGIPVENIDRFTRCIQGIKNYSNYDPFKVIEKFSDLKRLEIEIENNHKIKKHLEMTIKIFKEKESEYNEQIKFKQIKLQQLEELETKVGFSLKELKKLKSILIEISLEHKNLNIEQIKILFFELLEKIETRIALESEINENMKLNILLQNQIKSRRQILQCQQGVGPILKNLFDAGIGESNIVDINALIDILLYTKDNNMQNLNNKREIIDDLSSYIKLRQAKSKIVREINAILKSESLNKLQGHIDNINKSLVLGNNSGNLNNKKLLVLCDSIF